MLDKLTRTVLKKISESAQGEEYIIIKLDELKEALPFKSDKEGLLSSIKFLQKQEMVSLKYSDEDNVCLAILPQGRLYLEEQEALVKQKLKKARRSIVSWLGVFLAAMLGTIVGQLIIKFFEWLI
ncbi:MAG TPA: hypothetical protein VIL03_03065 [Clostridia bacterium]|jgi:hypothetical protein